MKHSIIFAPVFSLRSIGPSSIGSLTFETVFTPLLPHLTGVLPWPDDPHPSRGLCADQFHPRTLEPKGHPLGVAVVVIIAGQYG